MSVIVNINGIDTLAFPTGVASATTTSGTTTISLASTHAEPLTDGNANFIFSATLTQGGDVISVVGVPN